MSQHDPASVPLYVPFVEPLPVDDISDVQPDDDAGVLGKLSEADYQKFDEHRQESIRAAWEKKDFWVQEAGEVGALIAESIQQDNTLGAMAAALPFVEVGDFDEAEQHAQLDFISEYDFDHQPTIDPELSCGIFTSDRYHEGGFSRGYDPRDVRKMDDSFRQGLDAHAPDLPHQIMERYGRAFFRRALGEEYFDDEKRAAFVAAVVEAEMMLAELNDECGYGVFRRPLGAGDAPSEVPAATPNLIGISAEDLEALRHQVVFGAGEVAGELGDLVGPTAVERVAARIAEPASSDDYDVGHMYMSREEMERFSAAQLNAWFGDRVAPLGFDRHRAETLVRLVSDLSMKAGGETIRKALSELASDDEAWDELMAAAKAAGN